MTTIAPRPDGPLDAEASPSDGVAPDNNIRNITRPHPSPNHREESVMPATASAVPHQPITARKATRNHQRRRRRRHRFPSTP